MNKETLERYANKVSLADFDEFNSNLSDKFKISILGDGKYHLVEDIIKNTIEQVLYIQEHDKPILKRDNKLFCSRIEKKNK